MSQPSNRSKKAKVQNNLKSSTGQSSKKYPPAVVEPAISKPAIISSCDLPVSKETLQQQEKV